MDNGKISTILITIITPLLGCIAANPQPITEYLNTTPLAQYTPLLLAIIIAAYNYLNPRPQEPEEKMEA